MNKEYEAKIKVCESDSEPEKLLWQLIVWPKGAAHPTRCYYGACLKSYADDMRAGKVTEDLKNIESHLGREGMLPFGALVHDILGGLNKE